MAGIAEKIYARMPVFAQNWAISVYGYHWKRRRFGGIFEEELYGFRERESYTATQWREYQTMQLRRLLLHAFDTVPYYREKYAAIGLHRGDLARFELEDLPRLPFLEKDELRRFGTSTLLSLKREKGGQFFSSSGSTGTPTKILYSHAFHQRWSAAFEARIRLWAGLNRNVPRGMIGGRRVVPDGIGKAPFYRYNAAERQVYFSAYHIAPYAMQSYLAGIEKHGISYMTGYAMSNFFLARLFEEAGVVVPGLKAVITSSEVLSDAMRATFKKVYGCKTYDSYSGVEACALISESEAGQLLISPDVGITEVLDINQQPVEPGSTGELICTGLLNFDQPLIRYRIGDQVRYAAQQSSLNGLNMPTVDAIEGRTEDVVLGLDGRKMVRFHSIYADIPQIAKAQVIQHDFTYFELLLEVDSPLSLMDKKVLSDRIQSQLGSVEVLIRELPFLPPGPNGKFRAVISHVKK